MCQENDKRSTKWDCEWVSCWCMTGHYDYISAAAGGRLLDNDAFLTKGASQNDTRKTTIPSFWWDPCGTGYHAPPFFTAASSRPRVHGENPLGRLVKSSLIMRDDGKIPREKQDLNLNSLCSFLRNMRVVRLLLSTEFSALFPDFVASKQRPDRQRQNRRLCW